MLQQRASGRAGAVDQKLCWILCGAARRQSEWIPINPGHAGSELLACCHHQCGTQRTLCSQAAAAGGWRLWVHAQRPKGAAMPATRPGLLPSCCCRLQRQRWHLQALDGVGAVAVAACADTWCAAAGVAAPQACVFTDAAAFHGVKVREGAVLAAFPAVQGMVLHVCDCAGHRLQVQAAPDGPEVVRAVYGLQVQGLADAACRHLLAQCAGSCGQGRGLSSSREAGRPLEGVAAARRQLGGRNRVPLLPCGFRWNADGHVGMPAGCDRGWPGEPQPGGLCRRPI